jgi:hypothetical protein
MEKAFTAEGSGSVSGYRVNQELASQMNFWCAVVEGEIN